LCAADRSGHHEGLRSASRLRVRPRSFRPSVGQDSRGGGDGRQESGEGQGRGSGSCFFTVHGMGAGARGRGAVRPGVYSLPGDRHPPRPCRLAYGGGTPASPRPWKRSAAPAHPSVRPSVNRPSAGGHGQRRHMHAHNTSPEGNNTKTTQPITLSLLSLSLISSLSLICPHILLYCPLLEANSSYPSLPPSPVACLV
jgi:hypothetical protein